MRDLVARISCPVRSCDFRCSRCFLVEFQHDNSNTQLEDPDGHVNWPDPLNAMSCILFCCSMRTNDAAPCNVRALFVSDSGCVRYRASSSSLQQAIWLAHLGHPFAHAGPRDHFPSAKSCGHLADQPFEACCLSLMRLIRRSSVSWIGQSCNDVLMLI